MMSTRLSIIVAVTRDWAIGRGGDLLFHVRDDLRRFKAITMGKPIIMGRKTFESFPNGALPGRRNIVITRQGGYRAPDIETVSSLQDALALVDGVKEAMIIGGGEIYRQALPIASRLYLTEIDATVSDADTYFPAIEPEKWTVEEESESMMDERSGVTYRFVTLCRK